MATLTKLTLATRLYSTIRAFTSRFQRSHWLQSTMLSLALLLIGHTALLAQSDELKRNFNALDKSAVTIAVRGGDAENRISLNLQEGETTAQAIQRILGDEGTSWPSNYSEDASKWRLENFGGYDQADEDLSKRNAFSKHFSNAWGSTTAFVASAPIHYPENGIWKTIFNAIDPLGQGYQNTTNFFKTFYPERSDTPISTVLYNGDLLTDMKAMRMFWLSGEQEFAAQAISSCNGTLQHNRITYPAVYGQSVDLQLTQMNASRKLDYILKDNGVFSSMPPGAEYLVFEEQIDLPSGYSAVLKDNTVELLDAGGKAVAWFTRPAVYEQKPIETEDETYSPSITGEFVLEQVGSTLILQTKVEVEWLTKQNRQFPVIVDPTIVFDAPFANFYTQTGFQGGCGVNYDMYVGRLSLNCGSINGMQYARSTVSFDIAGIPAGSTIDDIELNIAQWEAVNYGGNRRVRFRQQTTNPIEYGTYQEVFDAAGTSATQYTLTDAGAWSTGMTWRAVTLGNVANSYFETNSIDAGWFAVALDYGGSFNNSNRYARFFGANTVNFPFLEVDYTVGCEGPTTAGVLTVDKTETVSNDAMTYTVSGGGALVGYVLGFESDLSDGVFEPITDPEFSIFAFPNQDATLYVMTVHEDPGCPPSNSNIVATTLSCSSQLEFGTEDGDYITNVSFGTINNNSTSDYDSGPNVILLADAYQDFTSISADVCQGETLTLSVSGTNTFGANQGFAAWIDWNNDGVFDTSENVLLSAPTPTATASVEIPFSSATGEVKMRVLCAWNQTPNADACFNINYFYGEIEEYTVNIRPTPTAPTAVAGNTSICAGEPTTLTASGGSSGAGATFEWFEGGCGSGSVIGTDAALTVSPAVTTTYYVRRVGTADCTVPSDCLEITVEVNSCTYYSVESGNANGAVWNTNPSATTGEIAVFGPSVDFVVRNGQTVTVTENFTARSLTVEATNDSGTLTFSGEHTAMLYGNFTHSGGTLNAGDGTFLFNAGTPQTITTTAVMNHIVVNNAAGVSITGDLDLRGVLTIDQGDFTAAPHRVRLISNASGTAAIGTIAFGSSYVGEVNYERYIPSGNQNYVNLGNPILNKTLADWNTNLITTGFPGSNFPGNSFVNVLKYDETVPGGLNNGFYGPQNVNNPLDDTRGYFVFMQGAAQFIALSGEIQQGSRTIPLDYTSTGVPENDGWELMTNIYPSEISFDELYNASSGIASTTYIYDADNGSYSTYTSGLGLGTHNGYIPSGQSFWVQTFTSGASLTWEETHKSNEGTAFEREVNPDISYVSVGIAGNTTFQETYLVFEEGMSHAYDPGFDAIHMGSASATAPEISWKASTGQKLLLSRVPKVYQNVEVYLHLNIKQAGTYTITVDETQHLPEFTCMYFEDLETGDVYSLEAGEMIELTFEEPFNDDRFVLHVNAPVETSVEAPTCFNTNDAIIDIAIDNDQTYNVTITDTSGTAVEAQIVTGTGVFSGLPAGLYTMTADTESEVCQTMVIQVEVVAPDEPIVDLLSSTPFCNVLASGEIEVLASGAGSFTINLFDADNTQVFNEAMQAGALEIGNLNPGVYQLVVNNQCVSADFEVVLEDENAVLAQAVFNNEVVFENNAAVITANAACINADGWKWFVNGMEVADGGDLQYAINEEGVYTIELHAWNETCTDSFTFEVNTSTITYVQNAEKDEFVLGMMRESVVLWMPDRERTLLVDIYDAQGRLVYQDQVAPGQAGRLDVPTGNLATGTYILKASDDEALLRTWTIQSMR